MEAEFVQGSPLMLDHTADGDVSAGDVVVVGDHIRIAHRDIADGELGALAAAGGVYDCAKAAGTGIADGAKLYWDDTNNVVTATASTHKSIGFAVGTTASAATTQRVHHLPAKA